MMLYLAEGPSSEPQDLYFIAEEPVVPEIVVEEMNFWTPGRAAAITCTGVALLAGLAVAAYRKYRSQRKYIHDLEEKLEMQQTEVARLRDRLETQQNENLKTEMTQYVQSLELQRGRLDADIMMLEENLDKSKLRETKMERVLDEAKEQIESLQNQIAEKDLLIERTALDKKEMERRLEDEEKARGRDIQILEKQLNLFQERMESAQKEETELFSRLQEAEATNRVLASANECFKRANDQLREGLEEKENEVYHLEILKEASAQVIADLQQRNGDLEEEIKKNKDEKEKTRLLNDEVQQMRNWVAELGGKNAMMEEELARKELKINSLKNSLENAEGENGILKEEVQNMREWVAELGGQNAKKDEELACKELEINSLNNSLENAARKRE
ncbi:protein Spindly-like [Macrobrachium nipponense]|uniref:protein Spindly-like n=1 Tax=Macrobrachium nipponense TaxID=159736 RepID=UPI0030C8CEFA